MTGEATPGMDARIARGSGPLWRWLRRALLVAGAAVVLYLAWAIWKSGAVVDWMRSARPLPFFIALAVLPALGAPITPLFLAAGATFGIHVGLIGTALALAANLALCYWIARSRLRGPLEALLRRFGHALPDFRAPGRSALRWTLALKLAPGLPGFVKNYGLGAAGVPFPLYFGLSMLITGAYAAALVVLGESLFEHEVGRSVAVAVAIAAVVAGGVWWWWRRRRRRGSLTP
ncbi:MAG: hypothetical protein ACTHU0_37815 [Kofleriaceae bacterium]